MSKKNTRKVKKRYYPHLGKEITKKDWLVCTEGAKRLICKSKSIPNLSHTLVTELHFTPKTDNIKDIILKHWHILQNNQSLQETFEDPPWELLKEEET